MGDKLSETMLTYQFKGIDFQQWVWNFEIAKFVYNWIKACKIF